MERKNFNPLHLVNEWLKKREDAKRQKIIAALGEGELSAAQISRKTGMWSGTLYPLLFKMEQEGKISSHWSWPSPLAVMRKRLYKLAS